MIMPKEKHELFHDIGSNLIKGISVSSRKIRGKLYSVLPRRKNITRKNVYSTRMRAKLFRRKIIGNGGAYWTKV